MLFLPIWDATVTLFTKYFIDHWFMVILLSIWSLKKFLVRNSNIHIHVHVLYLSILFMPPRSKIGGHIVFVLSVILSLRHSVILSETLTLLINNFWTVSARSLIFHMSIPCVKTFPWVPLFLTLWPWPESLTYFFKT